MNREATLFVLTPPYPRVYQVFEGDVQLMHRHLGVCLISDENRRSDTTVPTFHRKHLELISAAVQKWRPALSTDFVVMIPYSRVVRKGADDEMASIYGSLKRWGPLEEVLMGALVANQTVETDDHCIVYLYSHTTCETYNRIVSQAEGLIALRGSNVRERLEAEADGNHRSMLRHQILESLAIVSLLQPDGNWVPAVWNSQRERVITASEQARRYGRTELDMDGLRLELDKVVDRESFQSLMRWLDEEFSNQ